MLDNKEYFKSELEQKKLDYQLELKANKNGARLKL
jgi:hypothetical protein